MTIDWNAAGDGALWIALTALAYVTTREVQRRLGGTPLANPVLLSAAPLIAALAATRTSYAEYSHGGWLLLWLLGPATVALAVPLYRNFSEVRSVLLPMVVALAVGSTAAVMSAIAIAWALGATPETIRSLAPKSVTTPIAMGIAAQIGGIPALTAAFVIVTGGVGAVCGSFLFNAVGVRDPRARGFAMGVAAHGMGTARAFQVSLQAGTFSGVAMTLNGIATAIVLPLLWLALS